MGPYNPLALRQYSIDNSMQPVHSDMQRPVLKMTKPEQGSDSLDSNDGTVPKSTTPQTGGVS